MKCQKMKKYLLRGLSAFMCLYLGLCSSIGSFASTNSGSSPTVSEVINDGNIYDIFSYVSRKYASFPDYVGGSPITSWSYSAYADWLDSKGQLSLLDEPVTIINESSGGRGYDIPQAVRQSMVDYVNEVYIQQNELTYTECYIHTYNMVNVQWFPTYQLYQTWKSWASQQDGYILTTAWYGNGAVQGIRACVIPKTNDINFVGSTTGGVFSNVALYIGWGTSSTPWTLTSNYKMYSIANNGTISQITNVGQLASTIGNTTNIHDTATSRMTIWTNLPKDEKVYVFNTLNALKAYNSASPQAYYLPTGSTMNVPYSDVFTDEDLLRAGSYYNSIVDNSQSGWTAEQVLALVDKILLAGGGSSGSSSGSDNDKSKWWEKLGDSLGNLIDGIINVLSTVIEHLSDALLSVIHLLTGYTDDNGVVHEGLFGKLLNLVNSDFNNFLASIFSWLPEEIVTLFTAVLVFGIFFGLLKMLRR